MIPGGWGSQILRHSANESGKVVSPMHRPPLTPENISGTLFCKRLSQLQGHSAAGRIMSMKNSNDTIGNQSHDLPFPVQFIIILHYISSLTPIILHYNFLLKLSSIHEQPITTKIKI
jgi:hypothetical protein